MSRYATSQQLYFTRPSDRPIINGSAVRMLFYTLLFLSEIYYSHVQGTSVQYI